MRLPQHLEKSARLVVQRLFAEKLENRILLAANSPSVNTVTPANGATGVALNVDVELTVNLPNGGVNPTTVNASTLYLYQTGYAGNNTKYVQASAKTTGGGDALLLSPLTDLKPNTSYTLMVTAAMMDVNGDPFTPFTEAFTTGNTVPAVSQSYAFSKTALPTTAGFAVTDVQVGPDGDLWASTEVGQILRFPINADGTLGTPQVITSLQTKYGGNRLITGFAFDPSFVANPSAPMIWVSNTYYALSGATNAPNFSSSLTVMMGANLQIVTDALIDLPRSVADHVNDQPVFQPGTNNLFFCQAGENAYGAPDTTWGNRAETLLSSAVLEVNTSALNLSGPALNVLTPDVGGSYNPYAVGAPVTIYATGIRNAFDLFFDENGVLWAPTNGSSSGGNSPANPSGTVPALTDIQQVEEDTLIKVMKGAYYGHPDPARGQYVLDDGNPASGGSPGLAYPAYPVGTNPDPNYHLPSYVFGLHASPDGIIEYQGSAFGGTLAGKFLIAEYSAPDAILVLARNSADNITTSPAPDHAVAGFTDLNSPVSLVEDDATGNVYVSELGGDKITLLTPAPVKATITPSALVVPFNTIATGNAGAAASRIQDFTITNTGADPLDISSISIINNPYDAPGASDFTIVNASSEPTALNALGNSFTFQLQYTATMVGLQSAILEIKSNASNTTTLEISLRGIGTAGLFGANEPSLVQVMRANDIPTIVGAGPNDVNINTEAYPETPDPSSQEVPLQILEKAGPGDVTITPIGSFTASAMPASTIGYYTPGNPATTTGLFSINQTDDQTITPAAVGTTSFDPGTNLFGLYGYFPGITTPSGAADYHFSEDPLNTPLDPVNPRKIRFFPYETVTGTVVPNTYVFAIEDYNDTTQNSFDNFVGIISNVTGLPAVPANLAASTAGNAGVVLTWSAAAGAATYTVQRQDAAGAAYNVIATGLASPTYTDVNVSAGATYSYEVQAVNTVGASAFSSPQTAMVAQLPPPAPTNPAVSSASTVGVVLTWNVAATATSYSVLRENPGASAFTQIASALTATTYTDINVLPNQTYQYEIVALNTSGASPASNPVAAMVPAGGMMTSSALSVTVGKGANKSVTFATSAGTIVLIKFNGLGTATVNLEGTMLSPVNVKTGVSISGSDISIASIVASGTGGNSSLTITTRHGDGSVTVGNLSADGSINSIIAPTTTLIGTLEIPANARMIKLGAAAAATTITIGGNVNTLSIPSVTGLSLTVSGTIHNLAANTWTSTDPITAATIGTLIIKGDAQLNINAATVHTLRVRGNLNDSAFLLSGVNSTDLAVLSAGSITNTDIDSAGNIGAISAGSLTASQIYAGTGATGALAFPPVASVFPTAATIGSINLKKVKGTVSLTNSNIAASNIKSLSLGELSFDNGGQLFGVEATDIKVLRGFDSSTGKSFVLNKLDSAASVTDELAAKAIATQDFAIQIL